MGNGKTGTPDQALQHYYNGALSQTKQTVFIGKGNLYGYEFENNSATDTVYLQFFDKLIADVTVGTTTPDFTFMVPAGACFGKDAQQFVVHYFGIGCVVACTSTRTGGSAPAANSTVHLWSWLGPQI